MEKLLLDIQFAKPLFLWLLFGLPLLWVRVRDQKLLVLLARTVILVLLIFGLADPQWVTRQAKQEERIFAFDLSQSVTSGMRRWMGATAARSHPRGSRLRFRLRYESSPRLARVAQAGRRPPRLDSADQDRPRKVVHDLAGSPRRAAKPLFVHRRLGNAREC
jgi:hypothetical protein